MSTLHRSLETVQTEIRELLGISTLQTASNLETESHMREIEKNIADLKAAVYKNLYRAYGHPNGETTAIVKSEKKVEVKKKSKGFRLPGFGKK